MTRHLIIVNAPDGSELAAAVSLSWGSDKTLEAELLWYGAAEPTELERSGMILALRGLADTVELYLEMEEL